jgi:hypothetical protein
MEMQNSMEQIPKKNQPTRTHNIVGLLIDPRW